MGGQHEPDLSSEEPTTMDGDLELEFRVAIMGDGGRWCNGKVPTKLFVYDMRRINLPGQQGHLYLICGVRGVRIEHPQLQISGSVTTTPTKRPPYHYNYTPHLLQMTMRKSDSPHCFFSSVYHGCTLGAVRMAIDEDIRVLLQAVRVWSGDRTPCG